MLKYQCACSVLGGLTLLVGACSGSSPSGGKGSGGTTSTQVPMANGGAVGLGGESALGGVTATGGTVAAGGSTGAPRAGGAAAGGGAPTAGSSSTTSPPGGTFALGGTRSTGGMSPTGGDASVGGASGKGGAGVTGGALGSGGVVPTGGASPRGGASGGGGAVATGGASSLGGAFAKGGTSAAGGVPSLGGASGSGGTSSKGGATGTATPLDSYVLTLGPITLGGISNASGIAWKPETDTFFVISNGTHALYEYSADFKTRLRTITLNNGGTDTEDVVYLGNNRFAVVDEENQAYVVTIADGATSANMTAADAEHYVVSAPPATTNRGFEGIAFRPGVGAAGQLIVCQEGGVSGTPIRVLFFDRRATAGTSSYADGTLVVSEPWNALSKLGAVATDLASVYFDTGSSTLLVLSEETSRLLRVVPESGQILDQRNLSGSPQYEGVTLADGGRLVLVSEPNYIEVYQTK
jgi:uncharacterized protein YjiK